MKTLLAPLVAVLCLSAVLAEEPKPWPQKGDTVYVPGELSGLFGAPPLVQFNTITVPACAPLNVAFQPKPTKFYVRDEARGAAFRLCDGWSDWVLQTRDACIAAKPVTFEKKDGCYSPTH